VGQKFVFESDQLVRHTDGRLLDVYSQGCPCPVTPPGIMSDVGKALREPFESIHFVGTETSFEWKGYMEGAVRSGERGATEVIEALSKEGKVLAKL